MNKQEVEAVLRRLLVDEHGWAEQARQGETVFRALGQGRLTVTEPPNLAAVRNELVECGLMSAMEARHLLPDTQRS